MVQVARALHMTGWVLSRLTDESFAAIQSHAMALHAHGNQEGANVFPNADTLSGFYNCYRTLQGQHQYPYILLGELSMLACSDIFVRNNILQEDLPFLNEKNLARMGFPVGSMIRLLAAIRSPNFLMTAWAHRLGNPLHL